MNVLIEGARQNFQRSGHNANGVFYMEPEMLKGVDITRGPTSVIYGSGAIGGVAAFSVLDADDILRGGETAAVRSRTRYTSNGDGMLYSQTAAAKAGNFDILGQYNSRSIGNYDDGSGKELPIPTDTYGFGSCQNTLADSSRPSDHRYHYRLQHGVHRSSLEYECDPSRLRCAERAVHPRLHLQPSGYTAARCQRQDLQGAHQSQSNAA